MSVISNNLLATPEGYQISRSVRLRSSASGYFNRTPASAGNRKTWTLSAWFKRGTFTAYHHLFSSYVGSGASDSNYFRVFIPNAGADQDKIVIGGGATNWRATTQVLRDPSAWYHLIIAADTTQATANNRFRVYLNGSEITSFSTLANPTQNFDMGINQAAAHYIGSEVAGLNLFDGYLTEINFIDGQALTPSSFGETNALTGVWQPKKYTGTYGTNGFYLNFSDNSGATATTIGKDYSGNGNNWTPNNISLTAGTTYDSMLDVPTLYADGGNGRGNYSILNPLDKSTSLSPTDANLTWAWATASHQGCRGTMSPISGLYYFESIVVNTTTASSAVYLGLSSSTVGLTSNAPAGSTGVWAVGSTSTSYVIINGSIVGSGTLFSAGTVLQCAYDATNNRVWLGANNVWYDSSFGTTGNPSTGANPTATSLPSGLFPYVDCYANTTNINFGQRPFTHTPPTGFKALNTQNLPTPTISKGNQYFDATLWTGNGSSQNIVNSGMAPDLVWIKSRSNPYNHGLFDIVRGANNALYSSLTNAESSESGVSAFNSNGFSLGSSNGFNGSTLTYVGWQWKEGATQGFDIVTGTAPASGDFTVSHSLGVAPAFIIVKTRGATSDWVIWHKSFTSASKDYINLNTTAAKTTSAVNVWGASGSTSTTLGLTSNIAVIASQTYVAYLFAEVAGFSRFGNYTGNGSADGPFVYCGFRPKFVMVKRSDSTSDWLMYDTSRNTYNQTNLYLAANTSTAESTGVVIDILSNGFKCRNTIFNVSAGTYIFAAFAENPTKLSLAR